MAAQPPGLYTDFAGFHALRAAARESSPRALREVAEQFEALFVQMMLASMRQASLGEGLMDSPQGDMYRDLYDKQVAMDLARGRGLGLADMLVNQLSGDPSPVDRPPGAELIHPSGAEVGRPSGRQPNLDVAPTPHEAPFDSPKDFVHRLLPAAQEAAAQLGTSPRVLLAQAALETGWGRAVPRRADGESSHNLFGIKADAGWTGERVWVTTVEHQDGVAVRRRAPFRAYASHAESMADYVAFLRTNPRYAHALRQAADPAAFARALQDAGYATDPAYAAKVRAILGGGTLSQALSAAQAPAAAAANNRG
jgi:flagellar protein FlgJ